MEKRKREREKKKKTERKRKEITQESNFAQMFANKMSFSFHIEILQMSLPQLVQKQILLFSYVLLHYLPNESWLGKNKHFVIRSLAQNTPSIWEHLENRLIFAASTRIFVTAQQNGALLTVRIMREKVPWKQGQSTALFA